MVTSGIASAYENAAGVSILFPAVISAMVALIVVALTHGLTSYRDLQNKRREQWIDYLVAVHRALCKGNNHPRLYEVAEEIGKQSPTYRSSEHLSKSGLFRGFADDPGTMQVADLNALLIELRDSLRSELGAKPVPKRQVWLRIKRLEEIFLDEQRSMPIDDHRTPRTKIT